MNAQLRLWVVFLAVLCALVTGFGMQPGFGSLPWPIAGLWAAAVLAPYGLSVWSAGWLLLVGIAMDYMTEAPLGAWPLALISAYGVALVAWDRSPPLPVWGAEAVSVLGGMIAAIVALGLAGAVSGHAGFSRANLMSDFLATALLYLPVRFLLIPRDIRSGKEGKGMVRR